MTKSFNRTIPAKWTARNAQGDAVTVGGTLEILEEYPHHLIRLGDELPGLDKPFAPFSFASNPRVVLPLIHGRTLEGIYTAIDSIVQDSHRNLDGHADITLRPSFVIHGGKLDEEDLFITEARVRYWDQDSWAEWIRLNVKRPEVAGGPIVIEQHALPTLTATHKGVSISFVDASPSWYDNSHPIHVKQRSEFVLKFPEPVALREFVTGWLNPLGFLIASGTRRTSGISSIYIKNSNWVNEEAPGMEVGPLKMTPRNAKRYYEASDRIRFLHNLRDFTFAEQIPKIFETYEKHGDVINQFLDFIHREPTTVASKFTALAQLVETFDRSLNPDPADPEGLSLAEERLVSIARGDEILSPYEEQLRGLLVAELRKGLAGRLKRMDIESGGFITKHLETKGWMNDVVSVRNAIIHGLETTSFFRKNLIPIQVSTDILRLLFEVRLLVALGFTPERAGSIKAAEPHFYGNKYAITHYLSSFNDFRNANKSEMAESDGGQ